MPPEINNKENETVKGPPSDMSAVQIDELGLTGLSALLTFSPYTPAIEFGERRTGRDRRTQDRRMISEAENAG